MGKRINFTKAIGLLFLVLGVFLAAKSFAITGPSAGAGVGSGLINVEPTGTGNLSVGATAADTSTKFQITGTTANSSAFGLKVWPSSGSVNFQVRNDGIVSIASTTYVGGDICFGAIGATDCMSSWSGVGGGVTSTPAGYITPGYFNSIAGTGGNYSFPASLSIGTSTAPTGGVVYVNGNVGIGTSVVNAKLHVNGGDLYVLNNGGNPRFLFGDSTAAGTYGGLQWNSPNDYISMGTGTGGLNTLVVTESANVGIGTTTPSYPLTVAGVIHSSTGGYRFPDGTTQTTAATAGTNYWTLSGTNLYPTSTAYDVGIGTASPATKLEIAGSHTTTLFRMNAQTGVASPNDSAYLNLWASEPNVSYTGAGIGSNINNTPYYGRISTARGGSYLRFLNDTIWLNTISSAGADTNAVYISGGKSGFGASSPDANYRITTAGGGIKAESTTQPAGYFNSSSGYGLIVNTGNVGIGTTTPGHKLNVVGSSVGFYNATNPYLDIMETGTGGNRRLRLQTDTTNSLAVINSTQASIGVYPLSFQLSNVEKMRIASNGYVGIATTTPSYPLTVAGVIHSSTGGYRFPDGTTQTTAASGGMGGSGTASYIPKFTAGTTLGNSIMTDSGSLVTVGGALTVTGKITSNSKFVASRYGLAGTYNSAEVQGVWSIGDAYQIDTTADTFGNQYGMGYAYSTNGGAPLSGVHQIVFTNNGTIGASIGLTGGAYFAGNVAAASFTGAGTGLTGTAASLTAGSANAVSFNGGLTTASTPTFAGITSSGNINVAGNYLTGNSYNQPNLLVLNNDPNWAFGGYSDLSTNYWTQAKFYGTASGVRGFRVLDANGSVVRMSINDVGTLTVNGGTGKINAGTIDPPYTINGEQYATYLSGMTGQKEETTGEVKIQCQASTKCEYVIDFAKAEKGSDLWLFSKTTNLRSQMDKMSVLLTPSFDGKVWYEKDVKNTALTIYVLPSEISKGSSEGRAAYEVSYRLTSPRFDSAKWSNTRNEPGVDGFVIND